MDRIFRVLAPCNLNMSFERSKCPPWGILGGGPGESSFGEIERADGTRERVHKVSSRAVAPGDRIHIHSAGGGGFGPAIERDPEAVRLDVIRGYVSAARAREMYGVVLTPERGVNAAATGRQRAAMK